MAYVVASPVTYLAFLEGHAQALRDEYDVTLLCDFGSHSGAPDGYGVETIQVGIQRALFSLPQDLLALINLTVLFKKKEFDIVHSVTPKAGLLAMLAGLFAGVPTRIHTFTGQVWVTRRGFLRWFLRLMDKITLFSSTHALADSPSQAAFLASEGFSKCIQVLGEGAVAGVNTKRFKVDPVWRHEVRALHGIGKDDLVFVFLGRLTRDKGVIDLLDGFERADLPQNCKLMFVGPDEEGLEQLIAGSPAFRAGRVKLTGYTSQPERELNAGDVLCLPSYREGFGMSVLEAGAIGLPAIASRIYGLTDSVMEGVTGFLHTPGDRKEIAECIRVFAQDTDLLARMGTAARDRVKNTFSPEYVTGELKAFYQSLTVSEST